MDKIYKDYTKEELDRQYDQRTLVPDIEPYSRSWRQGTEEARRQVKNILDASYGEHDDERLDIYLPSKIAETASAPILIFLHGGAWRGSSKEDLGNPALVFAKAGAVYVAPEFSLAPATSLDQIVNQVRRAVKFVYDNAENYGGTRDRIYLSGHSSGAHLASMITVTDWEQEFGCPPDIIKGVTLVSGPYDLEPVRLSARNDYLHLDDDAARRNSAHWYLPKMDRHYVPPALFAWGGGELDEFQRQSRAMAETWEKTGVDVQKFVFEDHNHFEMFNAFVAADSPLRAAMLNQLKLG